MYELSNIREVHLEVTSNCQARCPQCPRRINGGLINPFISIQEISFDTFTSWFNEDFIRQLDVLFMCGNLGDPIVARDTLPIFKYCRDINPGIVLKMFTNGSAKSLDWWRELAKVNVEVTWGIDGLEDTHSLYRIDTDFNKIIRNVTEFNNNGGISRWDMLVFEHNIHQVEDCRKLSEQLGFREFRTKHTNRFNNPELSVLDDKGRTTHIIKPSIKSIEMMPLVKQAQLETKPYISCKAKQNNSIYVAATGNISPCCWLDLEWYQHNHPSRIDYMDKINLYPNLYKSTIESVFSSNFFNNIESKWSSCGLKECSKQCGSFDKMGSQYDKSQ